MQARTPGIYNLRPEIFYEQIEDLRKIGIDLSSGLELALAQSVIINTLGGDFWANECTSFGQKQDFFANKGAVRIIYLAHMLWSLKDQDGFAEFLIKNSKDDFEPTYYEVTAAYLFLKNSESIRFVIPTYIKGSDFDIEVRNFFPYGSLNVEVKARQKAFSTGKQALDRFKQTRKQLPKDGNGVIFCKIELSELLTQEELIRAAQDCLKTTNRISFIVYCWDAWNFIQEGIALAYKAVDQNGEMNSIFGETSIPVRLAFFTEAIEWSQKARNT
jgi:hypothetical protein